MPLKKVALPICAVTVFLQFAAEIVAWDPADVDPRNQPDMADARLLNTEVGDMEFADRSIEYVLGQLLIRCRSTRPELPLHVLMWSRDRRITEEPSVCVLKDDALLDANPSGGITFVARNLTLLGAMRGLLPQVDFTFKMTSHSNESLLHVGPQELLSRNYRRLNFRVADGIRGRVAALRFPQKLSIGGTCIAYDQEKGVLTIIDESSSLALTLAAAIGEPMSPVGHDPQW